MPVLLDASDVRMTVGAMSRQGEAPLPPANQNRRPVSIVTLTMLVVLLMVTRAWVMSHVVLTPDVYARLLTFRVNAGQAYELAKVRQHLDNAAIGLMPLIIVIRAAVITSLLQLSLLAFQLDIRFGRLFRAVMIGELILAISHWTRTAWLLTLPQGALTARTLNNQWESLSQLLPRLDASNTFASSLAQQVTIAEVIWCAGIVYVVTRDTTRMLRVVCAVTTLWLSITTVELLIGLFLSGAKL